MAQVEKSMQLKINLLVYHTGERLLLLNEFHYILAVHLLHAKIRRELDRCAAPSGSAVSPFSNR